MSNSSTGTWFIAVVVGDVKVIRDGVEVLLEKMQEVVGSEVRMRNSIKEMLDDAEKEHQREREEARKERQEAKRDREEAKREREEHAGKDLTLTSERKLTDHDLMCA